MKKHPAIFLDRDGTILNERGYLDNPHKLNFYRSAFKGLQQFLSQNYKLVIITNQSGIGRGYFTEKTLSSIHKKFRQELAKKGIFISGIYYCPHLPTDQCACRKPKVALARQAARELNLDLKNSFMIGDQARDVELGKNMGGKGILVLTGGGRVTKKNLKIRPDKITPNLFTASQWILDLRGKK